MLTAVARHSNVFRRAARSRVRPARRARSRLPRLHRRCALRRLAARAHHELLCGGVFGNPHSDSAPSRASTDVIGCARRTVLRFLDVDESTHARRLHHQHQHRREARRRRAILSGRASLLLSADNHNSVNGIREYARRAGARSSAIPLDGELRLRDPLTLLAGVDARRRAGRVPGAVELLRRAASAGAGHAGEDLGFDVLLDVAAYVPGHVAEPARMPGRFRRAFVL